MPYYRWNFIDKDSEMAFIDWLNADSNIVSFSFGKGIIALFENGSWAWTSITKNLDNKLRGRQRILPRPVYVTTDAGNRYYIQFADGNHKWKASRSFSRAINYSKSVVLNVAFAPRNGWYILFKDGSSAWNNLPRKLHNLLKKQKKKSIQVKLVSISNNGDWFVSNCDGSYDAQFPTLCQQAFEALQRECSPKIDHVMLGKNGAFCIVYDIPTTYSMLPVWDISFSQALVEPHFSNNQSLWKVISDLEKCKLNYRTIPPIHVVRKENRWISLNNRRLFVFQNAAINNIPVIVLGEPPEGIKAYRSVQVVPCECKICSFGESSTQNFGKPSKLNDDTWARSWSWRLFLKEEVPPSVFLLANSFVLPSVRHFNKLGKKIDSHMNGISLLNPMKTCEKQSIDNDMAIFATHIISAKKSGETNLVKHVDKK